MSRSSCSAPSCPSTRARSACRACAPSSVTCPPPATAGSAGTGTSPPRCPQGMSCSRSGTWRGTARPPRRGGARDGVRRRGRRPSPPSAILLGAGRRQYEAASVTLEAGDLLLFYSDGLIERRDRPLEDGLATLCWAAAGGADPEQVIDAVLGALGSTDPEDD